MGRRSEEQKEGRQQHEQLQQHTSTHHMERGCTHTGNHQITAPMQRPRCVDGIASAANDKQQEQHLFLPRLTEGSGRASYSDRGSHDIVPTEAGVFGRNVVSPSECFREVRMAIWATEFSSPSNFRRPVHKRPKWMEHCVKKGKRLLDP